MGTDIDAWLDDLDIAEDEGEESIFEAADDESSDSIFDIAEYARGDAIEVTPDGCYVVALRGGRYSRIRKIDEECGELT